jgi:hypothetical protein
VHKLDATTTDLARAAVDRQGQVQVRT